MANMHLVTGHGNNNHVAAADDGSLNAAIFGTSSYVLNRGNKFSATVVTNNNIRIADGDLVFQGRHVRINEGTHVDLQIDNGTQGYKRNDLIVARYTKNSGSGIEEANLVVIKGTPTTGTPSDPSYVIGDIIEDHVTQADFPLYRISLNGLTVGTPVALFQQVTTTLTEAMKSSDLASWARASTKPSYTAQEVGAAPASHQHDASAINSGILPVSRGGTGKATATEALASMFAAGATVLSSNQFGTELPAPGTPGRIFFKKLQ